MQQHYELTSTQELLTLAAYVSKDGLVGHHWKERPIGHANFYMPQYRGTPGPKGASGWLGELGWVGMGDFWYSTGNVNEIIPNKKLKKKESNKELLTYCILIRAALPEVLSSIPNNHMVAHNHL